MAGRIRSEDIEAVRERADIVKVIGEYLSLKKAGHDSYVGLCPFHTEKTPSFSVSPAKQVYYCFGCQAGGDVVRFLQELEHYSFRESIEALARGIGFTLRYEGDDPAARKAASRRQALFTANEQAGLLYNKILREGKEGTEARDYLAERGIDAATIETFQIGFAPPAADLLLRTLAKQVAPDLLVEAGLATKDAGGMIRDRFRGRITFPITDISGRSIGFGGRILPSSDVPAKYINTSETPVYKKGSVLYNLQRAKGAAGRSGEVVVVEGYTDVIALAQAGIEATVATCGTALTEDHVRLLSRFAQRAVLTFDGDEAGARAAERAYAFHQTTQLELVVLIIPGGSDPADFVREHGEEGFRTAMTSARPLVEYMLRRATERADHTTVEGRSRAVNEALPLIEGLQDPVRQREYAHLLADLAGVDDAAVLDLLRSLSKRPKSASTGTSAGVSQAAPQGRGHQAPGSVQDRVEWEMLKVLAQEHTAFQTYKGELTPSHFTSDRTGDAFAALLASGGDVRSLIGDASTETGDDRDDNPDTDPGRQALLRLAVEPVEGDPGEAYARSVWQRIEELRVQRLRDEARVRLQRLNPITDPDYDDLFQELVVLDRELRELRR